jgi:hypothetical protein
MPDDSKLEIPMVRGNFMDSKLAIVTKGTVPKDRTAVERQRRYRQRRKLRKTGVTVTLVTGSVDASAATPSQPKRHGAIPVVMACAALAVGAVSASFSIIGLTAVFTGAFWPVVGMGTAMECAKLSAVAWLGRRYAASRVLKSAIVVLVVTLIGLNAIGSYGFLAKAHLDHAVSAESQVADLQAQIDARKGLTAAKVADIDQRIAQIDNAVNEATKRGRTVIAMNIVEHQTRRRTELVEERTQAANALAALQVEGAGIAREWNELAADLGPVRYLAALIGTDDEKVMHWFVLAVALLLDPLAVALLLAASVSDCSLPSTTPSDGPARGEVA